MSNKIKVEVETTERFCVNVCFFKSQNPSNTEITVENKGQFNFFRKYPKSPKLKNLILQHLKDQHESYRKEIGSILKEGEEIPPFEKSFKDLCVSAIEFKVFADITPFLLPGWKKQFSRLEEKEVFSERVPFILSKNCTEESDQIRVH